MGVNSEISKCAAAFGFHDVYHSAGKKRAREYLRNPAARGAVRVNRTAFENQVKHHTAHGHEGAELKHIPKTPWRRRRARLFCRKQATADNPDDGEHQDQNSPCNKCNGFNAADQIRKNQGARVLVREGFNGTLVLLMQAALVNRLHRRQSPVLRLDRVKGLGGVIIGKGDDRGYDGHSGHEKHYQQIEHFPL